MRKFLVSALVTAAILQPAGAFACVQAAFSDLLSATVCTAADACRTILYTQLGTGSTALKESRLLTGLQAFLDTRLSIDSFPPEDPAKAEDPGLQPVFAGRFFWSDADGNPTNNNSLITTHVTSRNCVVRSVTWDGARFSLVISFAP